MTKLTRYLFFEYKYLLNIYMTYVVYFNVNIAVPKEYNSS